MTADRYAELQAEIDRLRGDQEFERDVAEQAADFGPPLAGNVIDDSGYFTATRIDELLAAGRIRDAAVLAAAKEKADSWPPRELGAEES